MANMKPWNSCHKGRGDACTSARGYKASAQGNRHATPPGQQACNPGPATCCCEMQHVCMQGAMSGHAHHARSIAA